MPPRVRLLIFRRRRVETADHFSAIWNRAEKMSEGQDLGKGEGFDAPERTAPFQIKGLVFLERTHIARCLLCQTFPVNSSRADL